MGVDAERLLGNADASVWAEEFCKEFVVSRQDQSGAEHGDIGDQVGLMLAWFANAIETGRSDVELEPLEDDGG